MSRAFRRSPEIVVIVHQRAPCTVVTADQARFNVRVPARVMDGSDGNCASAPSTAMREIFAAQLLCKRRNFPPIKPPVFATNRYNAPLL